MTRTAPEWLTRWEYAHRGLHSDSVPENSLAAAQAAIAAGLGVECDIQRSADNLPIVFHDWDLDRLTSGTGPIEDHAAADIELLSFRGTSHQPARLEQLLSLIDGRVPLLIELKSRPGYDVEKTCAGVADLLGDYAGDHAVMSFDPRVCEWFHHHGGGTPCGLTMREDEVGYTQTAQERQDALDAADPDFLAYHIDALPNAWVQGLRENGLTILAWTITTPLLRARAATHADVLISEEGGLA